MQLNDSDQATDAGAARVLRGYRRAKSRYRAEVRDRDDRLSKLQDDYEVGSGRHEAIDQDDEWPD